jgi:hypothetical protein
VLLVVASSQSEVPATTTLEFQHTNHLTSHGTRGM